MTVTLWLIVALVIVLALVLVGYAACAVGGACDARLDEGDYADEARNDLS